MDYDKNELYIDKSKLSLENILIVNEFIDKYKLIDNDMMYEAIFNKYNKHVNVNINFTFTLEINLNHFMINDLDYLILFVEETITSNKKHLSNLFLFSILYVKINCMYDELYNNYYLYKNNNKDDNNMKDLFYNDIILILYLHHIVYTIDNYIKNLIK